jgi:hypothetical protein
VLLLMPFPANEHAKENGELHEAMSKQARINDARSLTTTKSAIITGSFHSLETPPHWSGRRREMIMPTERTLPTQSMRSHFSNIVLPSYSLFSGGGWLGRKTKTANTD